MQRTENAGYQHARQACYLCLNNHDGIDTEVQIDYEGVLWLCKGCVRAMALACGFRLDEDRQPEIDKLRAQLDEASDARNFAEYIVIELERKSKDMHKRRMERVRAAKKEADKEPVGAEA